ncbi:MAG: (2Fe-2S)-binding protein [Nitrososphaerota archaeon]|nr:(2Fe-2S)-binding protein [Nitrososphaerota archaeon]MDG7024891.1 (2Fe-2S)-binding protein [Nitrososphaerota archaeon]
MAEKRHITVSVNGVPHEADVEPRLLLVHFLRENLGLTGTHSGCDTTNCGACTVVMDGRTAKSCTVLAVQADGREILTVEGLAQEGRLHPIQEAFLAEHGLQCGFCTPGMLMSADALLEKNSDPTDDEIRNAISGNICRCTGYVNVIRSVRRAARKMNRPKTGRRR